MKYAGADHIESCFPVIAIAMSDLGRDVADLLGQLYQGIYHIPTSAIYKATWSNPTYIEITLHDGDFATCDFPRLTNLVILCHDRCLRCEISSRGFGYLMLRFHRRQREGAYYQRHPTIEDAVKKAREVFDVEAHNDQTPLLAGLA